MPTEHSAQQTPPPDTGGAGARGVGTGLVIGALAGAGVTVSIMQTLVVAIIPQLPRLLHTGAANTSWVVTATLLTAAVATPVLGRLGDMYGKRRMMLTCAGVVVAGSLVCAFSTSVTPLVAGRALQGTGLALIPLGISLMRDTLPADRLNSGLAFMSSSLGIGGALGLPASAAIAQVFGWHALFWASAVLVTGFATLIYFVVPESSVRVAGRIDVLGVLGLAVGLIGYLLGISKGGDWGWSSPTTIVLFAIAVVVLTAWTWWELRVASPTVDIRTTTSRSVLFTNLTGFAVGLAMYAMNLLAPELLQLPRGTGYGMGLSLLTAGLWMIPTGLSMVVFSQVAARVTIARGPKTTLLTGIAVIAAGNGAAQFMLGHLWGVVAFTVTVSIGVAFAYAAMPALIMAAVEPTQTAAANGFNTLCRSLGTSTASAIIGTVLGQFTMTIGGSVLPSEIGVRVVLGMGVIAGVLALTMGALIPYRKPVTPTRDGIGVPDTAHSRR